MCQRVAAPTRQAQCGSLWHRSLTIKKARAHSRKAFAFFEA